MVRQYQDKGNVSLAFLVTNIIRVILSIAQGVSNGTIGMAMETIMIEIIITILTFVALMMGVKLLTEFFDLSMNEVEQSAKKYESVTTKIVEVVVSGTSFSS